MEDLLFIELRKELNWKQKILARIIRKTTIKIYKKGIERGVNAIL